MGRLGLVGVLLLTVVADVARAADWVWIEGEDTAATNVKPNIAGWGHAEFLSGGKWLHLSIDAEKVDTEVPADGALLSYQFTLSRAGEYEIWNRIGFEFVRSPFEWRMDDGAWSMVGPDELTTDLMELSEWCEVAWLKLGERELTAGPHTLQIRIPRTKDDKGKTARILYASDALCIHEGAFHPYSRFKPAEDWRTPQDLEASRHVFNLPEAKGAGQRVSIKLNGLWEVCRHDEQTPREVAAPMQDFPAEPRWTAIEVPGNKNEQRPDLLMAHRLWYRTRVNVPPSLAGRSFLIVFPQNNLNTTVYVNGVYCGFDKNPFARVQIDVTRGMRPGLNELWVGIRDAWYGRSANPNNPMKLRRTFNIPVSFFGHGWQDLAYPIWNHGESGILQTPELVAAGPAYIADVFCKPSVGRHEMAAEITVANNTPTRAVAELRWEAVSEASGQVEKTFTPVPLELDPGATRTLQVAERWDDPKLWWPDDPNLYRLRTSLVVGGELTDVTETTFGFREWTWVGRDFRLNGIPWHGWADCHSHRTKEAWLEFHRRTNQRMVRFWGTTWMGLAPDDALDFFDRHGVVCRRSGMMDGQAIGAFPMEHDPDLQKLYGSDIKIELARNWQDQVVAQVKGERNHPSIMIWSIENEWSYIAANNLGLSDKWEPEITKVAQAVMAADPTRPVMLDGGGANKDQSLPVHGDHYTTGPFWKYPALAYDPNVTGGGKGRWVWDEKRPRFIGEELFAEGHNPAYAYFGGEEVFIGQQSARRAVGIFVRMLTEGYRWTGIGAWHFWQSQHVAVDQYQSNAPRAVFCRQWDWTFGSGQPVRRTLGIFNDTRFADPLTLTWTLRVAGQEVGSETREYQVPPGGNIKFDITLPVPQVAGRQEGEFELRLTAAGQEVYRDVKAVSVLRPALPGEAAAQLTAGQLCVYDPSGVVPEWLGRQGLACTALSSLGDLPADARVLIVGKDALDAVSSTSDKLAAFASAGRAVIVLEQQHPLRAPGLPAEMAPEQNEGRTAFAEDLGHPALRTLQQKDFFTWGPDEVVYRNAYVKPTRGAKSLIQCHEKLQNTALVEVPVGTGLLLLSQLTIGEKLGVNPVAQQMLFNLIAYGAEYKLEYRPVVACVTEGEPLDKVLDAMGLEFTRAVDPLEALARPECRIALLQASPVNLRALAAAPDRVRQFTDSGGWLVLSGLTPEGLADYNRLVGVEHLIRPFKRERVTFPPVRHPLTSGLTLADVALYSSERIFPWREGNFVASDEFSYVVDYEDVAPFARFENDFVAMMTNGMVSADAWKYIVNVPAPDNPPLDFKLVLPREEELVEMEWIGNTFYYPVTRVELIADGGESRSFVTEPTNEPQVFAIEPPLRGREITLRLANWEKLPGVAQVTGLDNIRLKARRSPEFYRRVQPMLNIGAMMAYPRGQGGIVLCNLLFKEQEDPPENGAKKRNILATILRNLQAPFAALR